MSKDNPTPNEQFEDAMKVIGLLMPEQRKVVCDYIFSLNAQVMALNGDVNNLHNRLFDMQTKLDRMQQGLRDAGNT